MSQACSLVETIISKSGPTQPRSEYGAPVYSIAAVTILLQVQAYVHVTAFSILW